jgi:hypothetical protein
LLTQKAADFILFKQVVDIMSKRNHFSIESLKQIINIKATMNLGLSDNLKTEFSQYIPVERPNILINQIPDLNWLFGFPQVMVISMLKLENLNHIK